MLESFLLFDFYWCFNPLKVNVSAIDLSAHQSFEHHFDFTQKYWILVWSQKWVLSIWFYLEWNNIQVLELRKRRVARMRRVMWKWPSGLSSLCSAPNLKVNVSDNFYLAFSQDWWDNNGVEILLTFLLFW